MKAFIDAALDETPVNVKGAKGVIDRIVVFNPDDADPVYLKVWDSTDAANTTAPDVAQIGVAAGQTVVLATSFTCSTGIRVCASATAATGAQTGPSTDPVVTIHYR
jgi:hypothetical protein